jgi:hypothetical protein
MFINKKGDLKMSRKIKVRLSKVIAILMVLSVFSFFQKPYVNTFAAPNDVLLTDDFEDGNASGWTKEKGTWSVVKDGTNYVYYKSGTSEGRVKIGDSSYKNYSVQGKIKIDNFNGNNKGLICGRYKDSKNYYAIALSKTNGGTAELIKMVNGKNTILKSVNMTISTSTWYTVKLDMSESTIKGYINGELKFTATDTSLISGSIALAPIKVAAKYDDILVTNLQSEQPITYPTPIITPDTTAANVSTVTVTINNFGTAPIKQYKVDDGSWQVYAAPIVVNKNCTVYAQGSDTLGNKSTIGNLVISNIGSVTPPVYSNAIYVSPSGNDSNKGTIEEPIKNLSLAASATKAGNVIYMRGGTYKYSETINLQNSGTETAPIKICPYPGEKVILDFSDQVYGAALRGIYLTGNYWYINGLEIIHAGDNGIKVEGSHNKIENCSLHHNGDSGIQLGFAHATKNPDGELCAYNEIINCDSYMNFDFDNAGSDADGFACKMHNGKGNKFIGCRSWRNSDDGFDLFETDWGVEILNCFTWHNGDQADFNSIYEQKMGKKMSSFQGNGNGFKLGGNGTGGSSKGVHIVKNSVAFDNYFRSKKGFDQNSHKGGVIIENCLSFGNGYNYMFEDSSNMQFKNNVSFGVRGSLDHELATGSVEQNNSWNIATIKADAADFIDLTEESAKAQRNSDGSLPSNSFARLVNNSDLIDKGVDVGLPFKGVAPDLGAYECK